MGLRGVTGNTTTVYAIEENGDPNEPAADATKSSQHELEEQYFIKWKGWSHIHNTWESDMSLRDQKVKGLKKLENYLKKEKEIEMWRTYAGPEDIDYYECQLELQQDLLKNYNFVDRIIAQVSKPDGSIDYLCKWECLPYSESTWEDVSLVARKWPGKISEFETREASKKTPSKHTKVLRYRPKFHHVKEQPDYMGLDRGLALRDYQMDGLNWLILTWCKDNSVILADEMGLGKTIQTICFLYYLFMEQHLHGPFLCVVPLSTMTAWQREFAIWAPDMNIVTYLGDVQSRETIRQYEWTFDGGAKSLKFNAILTTYEILLKDKAFLGSIGWAALLVDEAHRLKNDDSLLYKALYDFQTNHRLLITGTPLQNSLKELWALLHFIMPGKFETWEDFEKLHGNAEAKGYAKLHKQLEPYILRRVKKEVEKSLPAKVEQILRVEMTSVQKQYYKWILTKNFNALRKGVRGSTSTFLNIVIELKKCCNHAMLIRPLEYEAATNQDDAVQMLLKGSGKLVLLDKLLCRLRETGHRVLIFSQMVRMLDILAEYLQKRHFPFQRLDGSIKGEIRKQALDHFNAEGSLDFCFLLSTRAGGLGINLATADTVIIFDSDWNPQNDLQAQARAHRIGQKNQVNIYRLVTARSVEEEIVERAKQKMVLDHLVIQRMDTTGRTVLDKNGSTTSTPFNKEDLSAILKFGAEELFKDEPEGDGDDLVCDIDEILRRAETRDDAPAMIGDELLSAFKVASFAAFDEDSEALNPQRGRNAGATDKADATGGGGGDTAADWDDIIPERLRKAAEDQERNKEMEDLYLPPRRKTLQQINQQNDEKSGSGGGDGSSRKRRLKASEDESDDGSDGSVDGQPRRRGRPPKKEKFVNFTEPELRRFIKSYRKFPAPLKRLEAIACDAELQEKPLADLRKIGEQLHERCVSFMEEHASQPAAAAAAVTSSSADVSAEAKKRGARAGYSLKFGGVSFNAKTMLTCEEELRPLDEVIPANADDRLKWSLDIKMRPANFDVDWTSEDDSKLLCGIYQYGIGSWEAMKMDPSLGLADKILSNDNKKPQVKHLQSRAEYMLKVIKKSVELKKGVGKTKGKKKPKVKSKDIIEHDPISSDDDLGVGGSGAKVKSKSDVTATNASTDASMAVDNDNHATPTSAAATAAGTAAPKKGAARAKVHHKEPKKGKKKTDGPMHFTANNEPRALNVLGDLDPTVFNECKEKMRPVKKALKALDNPDQTLSTQDQVNHTRACLLSIGRQIDECLNVYKEPDKVKEWRSNLWYFVSKFTEFDAKKLFKLYKHALKRTDDGGGGSDVVTYSALNNSKDSNSQSSIVSGGAGGKGASAADKKASAIKDTVSSPTSADKIVKEKRERKEKKRAQKDKNRAAAAGKKERAEFKKDGSSITDNGHHRIAANADEMKRKLEDGECEPDLKHESKRLHADWSREDRKKWDSPAATDRDGRIRRNSGSQMGLLPPPRGAAPTTPQRVALPYADPRGGGAPPLDGGRSAQPPGSAGAYGDADRWNQRDRYDELVPIFI